MTNHRDSINAVQHTSKGLVVLVLCFLATFVVARVLLYTKDRLIERESERVSKKGSKMICELYIIMWLKYFLLLMLYL